MFDHFDVDVQSDELRDGEFDHLCPNCGTDHSNPDDESACYAEWEDEASGFIPSDDGDDEIGYNPYLGTYDDDC